MTIDEIRASDKEVLTPADIAPLLGCKPYSINVQAHADKSKLGFKVVITNRRVKIPRRAFLEFWEGRK